VADDHSEDFLLAVVNAADSSRDADVRRYFVQRYGEWFSPFEGFDLHTHKAYYREVIEWWNTKLMELPLEEPDQRFGLHVVILRRKLRVIWLLASSGAEPEAMHRIDQLSTHYYRSYYLDLREQSAVRRDRLYGACCWLRSNVEKLKVCENPQCERTTKYFLRKWNNNKYCSDLCVADAQEQRRLERRKNKPLKAFIRSDEAREKMSQSATKRWERDRKESGLKRGEHTRSRKRR
jgi:hypothetical protein